MHRRQATSSSITTSHHVSLQKASTADHVAAAQPAEKLAAVPPTDKKLADSIAKNAHSVAMRTNTVGWCYRGVKEALRRVGVMLSGTAAWMAKAQLLKDPRFAVVPIKDLKKGDILVHGRSDAHPFGHIAVYLGANTEASDHVQHLVTGGCYGGTCVFRPVGSGNSTANTAATTAVATAQSAEPKNVLAAQVTKPATTVATASPVKQTKTTVIASRPMHRRSQNNVLAYINHGYARSSTRSRMHGHYRTTSSRQSRYYSTRRHNRGHISR